MPFFRQGWVASQEDCLCCQFFGVSTLLQPDFSFSMCMCCVCALVCLQGLIRVCAFMRVYMIPLHRRQDQLP